MTSLNSSISAPNEYESEKILLTPEKKSRITFIPSKKNTKNDDVIDVSASVAEADIALSDYVAKFHDAEQTDKNLHLESYKNLINKDSSIPNTYLLQKERNSRYHHLRSEINSFRKARRRAILKNGDCNVVQVHISERKRRYLQDIFTTLVDAQWRWTFLSFVMSFLLSWLAFAISWWLIAYSHGDLLPENLNNSSWVPCVISVNGFVSSFLFSIETQHSTGYGYRYPTPECFEAVILVCIQSILGVMIQAFMVGIVFAKMARPKQRKQTLLFSRNCVVCQRDGELCLQFRVGDMREKSHLINSSIRLYLIQPKHTQEGEVLTPYLHELSVQVDDYNDAVLLIWPMIVMHKINSESPLYEMGAAELLYERFEIVAMLEGTSESTGQTTQVRTSYLSSEILWGHRFQPLIKYNKEKLSYEVDYESFHDTYQVDTPLCSAEELQRYLQTQINSVQ